MTIKEIARLANVSIGTVDRVINNRGRVSKETEETIRKIIKESGYTTNIFARRLSLSKTYVFSVLMPKLHQDSQYWEMSAKGIEKAATELKPYKVVINYHFYDRYSEKNYKKVIDNLLNSEMDGLLLAPVKMDLTKTLLSKISGKIPYVLFNADLPDVRATSFIGQDSFQSGVLAAKLMNLMVNDTRGLIAVIAIANDFHIIDRANGFCSFFKENADHTVKLFSLEGSNIDQFDSLMDSLFKGHPGIRGIFVPNSATHFAAEYIKRKEIRNIRVIGYDLVKENVELLNEKYIDFLISQKADVQGYEGIYALYKSVVLGEKVNNRVMMPIDVITKENLAYYH